MTSSYSMAVVPLLIIAVSLAWYVAVIVLLVKIWTKVRHLPG
jgi:hypothetical protein